MPIRIHCPQCARPLTLPDHAAGKRGKCPGCGGIVTVPAGGAAAASPPPAVAAQPPLRRPPAPGAPARDRRNPAAEVLPVAAAVVPPPATFRRLFRLFVVLTLAWLLFFTGGGVCVALLFQRIEAVQRARSSQFEQAFLKAETTGRNDELAKLELPTLSHVWYDALRLPLFLLGGLALVAQMVVFCRLLYKEWALIQDGRARTTPGRAIGFLFIPFFNLYWGFVAIRGLAEDLNEYARERGLAIREASVGLATAYLVLVIASVIPVLGLVLALAGVICMFLTMNSLKNAAADIAAAKRGEV